MRARHARAFALDELAWALGLRGEDIVFNSGM
jgi:hypothetical protein